jgi:transposase-like protein
LTDRVLGGERVGVYRRSSSESVSFVRYRFPPDLILLAVRWYLRYGLSYRDVEELLAERGIEVDQYGQVIDVYVSKRRNIAAARSFSAMR